MARVKVYTDTYWINTGNEINEYLEWWHCYTDIPIANYTKYHAGYTTYGYPSHRNRVGEAPEVPGTKKHKSNIPNVSE